MRDEENDLFGRLPVGAAVVKLQGRWQQPFQVMIPYQAIPKGSVQDAKVRAIMKNRNVLRSSAVVRLQKENTELPGKLGDREATLLIDVAERPYSGVVERYRRLGVSRRGGDVLKKALLERGFVEPVDIITRSGRMVLLEITKLAWEYLASKGIPRKEISSNEGLEHRFWKHEVAQLFEKEGYTVKLEEQVNGFTDIIIEKNGKRLPVEIETGKSDWKKNIEKNLKKGYSTVIVVATNPECLQKIQTQIRGQPWEVSVMLKAAQGLIRTQ